MAAGSSYSAENCVGGVVETNLLAKMNLYTSHTVADSLVQQNHTLNEIGSQVTKLSIEALEYNMDKADHVLQIEKLGAVIPTSGNTGSKYAAVRAYFSTGGKFPLEGMDDIFARNVNQGYVFARFLSVKQKFNAENLIKKTRTDGKVTFVTNRSYVPTFTSDIRESMENIKKHLWRLYENTIARSGNKEFTLLLGAFSRGIFVEEKKHTCWGEV